MPPGEQDTPPCDLQTVQKPQARPWNREGMGLRAHAPILGMLWSGNQSKGRELPLTRLAAVEGEADNHVRSSRRLWTGQLSHSSVLKLDGGRMAGPRPASVLQVSGPGLRGGCGKMLPERLPPRSQRPSLWRLLRWLLQGCAEGPGRGQGGCQSAGGSSRGPSHRASRRPHPSRSACAMVWGLVVQEGRLVLQLDCDKGGCKGIPGLGGAPARTRTATGCVPDWSWLRNLMSECLV